MAKPKPKAAKPKAAKPKAAKPKAAKPKATKPKAAKPKAAKPKHRVVVVAQHGDGILGSIFPFLAPIGL